MRAVRFGIESKSIKQGWHARLPYEKSRMPSLYYVMWIATAAAAG